MSMADETAAHRWLVLVHQLPPEPSALRVRVWRRLQGLGALALKSSVYLLPDGEEALEDFEWLVREIEGAGAEATLLRAELLEGVSDEECVGRFRAAAGAEYGELVEELRALAKSSPGPRGRKPDAERRAALRRELERARGRFAAIAARDFFAADGREIAGALLDDVERRLEGGTMESPTPQVLAAWRGKTWITRAGVGVDRMASAWLVRRFVDPTAQLRFVAARRVEAAPDTVRFDMFGGELTHEGDACTFETMTARLGLGSRALRAIGEIVHDLDLKDGKFGRPETAGVAAALDGIAAATADDAERVERAAVLFDALHARFEARR
jgi:hypothetical protein